MLSPRSRRLTVNSAVAMVAVDLDSLVRYETPRLATLLCFQYTLFLFFQVCSMPQEVLTPESKCVEFSCACKVPRMNMVGACTCNRCHLSCQKPTRSHVTVASALFRTLLSMSQWLQHVSTARAGQSGRPVFSPYSSPPPPTPTFCYPLLPEHSTQRSHRLPEVQCVCSQRPPISSACLSVHHEAVLKGEANTQGSLKML